jgi:hypothetical protein
VTQDPTTRAMIAAVLIMSGLLVIVGIYLVVRTTRETKARARRLAEQGKLPMPQKRQRRGKLPKVKIDLEPGNPPQDDTTPSPPG